jgi:hypothetical protein
MPSETFVAVATKAMQLNLISLGATIRNHREGRSSDLDLAKAFFDFGVSTSEAIATGIDLLNSTPGGRAALNLIGATDLLSSVVSFNMNLQEYNNAIARSASEGELSALRTKLSGDVLSMVGGAGSLGLQLTPLKAGTRTYYA